MTSISASAARGSLGGMRARSFLSASPFSRASGKSLVLVLSVALARGGKFCAVDKGQDGAIRARHRAVESKRQPRNRMMFPETFKGARTGITTKKIGNDRR